MTNVVADKSGKEEKVSKLRVKGNKYSLFGITAEEQEIMLGKKPEKKEKEDEQEDPIELSINKRIAVAG